MSDSFILTLKTYWFNGLETPWTIYVPLIMLATFALLSIVFSLATQKAKKPVVFRSFSAVYLSGLTTATLTLLVALILMHFTTFFAYNFCQLGFLIGLLCIAVITIGAYVKLCNTTKRKEPNAIGMQTTVNDKQNSFYVVKRYLFVLWIVSLMLAIPFVILAIQHKEKHLVSIVLDNSGSMDAHLNHCTQALEAALLSTPIYADYVFTTIDYTRPNFEEEKIKNEVNDLIEKNRYKSMDEAYKAYTYKLYEALLEQRSGNKIATNTTVFSDAISLYNSFAQIGFAQDSSPIYEGIWQNFLTSRQTSQLGTYDTKRMIVITDGADNFYWSLNHENKSNQYRVLKKDIFQETGKVGEKPRDFYNTISVINYGDFGDDLFFKDCEASIDETYDGYDAQSYYNAFRCILPEMFFDIYFLYILIGYAALLSLILLIIKLSKL